LADVYKVYYVKPLRWEGRQRCFHMIKERQHSFLAVSILHAIIESFFQSAQSSSSSVVTNVDIMNRREIIAKLATEVDLLNVLVNELCAYHGDRSFTFSQLGSQAGGAVRSDREKDS